MIILLPIIVVLFDIVKPRSQTKSHDWYSLSKPNLILKANNKVMKTVNWHVVVITYLTTRDVHLKIAEDLSTDKFFRNSLFASAKYHLRH